MKAIVKNSYTLPEIPSASGIEIIAPYVFIVGDDSNFLFVLDRDYRLVRKIELYQSAQTINGRIKKSEKADLEAITKLRYHNQDFLLIIGSGSTLLRETSFLIGTNPPFAVEEYSLAPLYEILRKSEEITGGGKLNIEGLAADESNLYLFQRGNISGNNALITFDIDSFFQFVIDKKGHSISFKVSLFELPILNTVLAGFSGGCVIPASALLLFTASVENTADEIADGETLGSYIGVFDISKPGHKMSELLPVMLENKELYKGKLESIAIIKADANVLSCLAVSDMDGAASEMIAVEIVLD